MSKFDEQMKRWDAIIGDTAERTQEDALKAFFKHLKSNLQLPCEVTGTEDFRWEEPYVIGGWSQQEYERIKVAATVGPADGVPGDRPGRVLRLGNGKAESQVRPSGPD